MAAVPQTHTSSPVKASKNVDLHNCEDVAKNLLPDLKQIQLENKAFLKLLGNNHRKFPTPRSPKNVIKNPGHIVFYLNELSQAIGDFDDARDRIHFVNYENYAPNNHPTGTICRPDIVAIKVTGEGGSGCRHEPREISCPTHKPETCTDLVWSELEATGEVSSKGKTLDEAHSQAATYALYHLQARPDLVSVVGILLYFKQRRFRLYVVDAWGVCYTDDVTFWDPSAPRLLMAWIRRLYNPERSPNIERVGHFPEKPTFAISAGHPTKFLNCSIMTVGSVRRRATIFENSSVVIKLQYYEANRRFEESAILHNIHAGGEDEFPGVVRVKPGGDASAGHGSGSAVIVGAKDASDHRGNETRQTLLVMSDCVKKRWMDAETPLDALIAIYDLLEVTRFLYQKRKILHRDISEGNVLLRENTWKTPFKSASEDMCFATCLLGEFGPNKDAHPLYTRVVLIDFHQAEDRSVTTGPPSTERSGTSLFVARLIRNPVLPGPRPYLAHALPQLVDPTLERYKACVGKRLDQFAAATPAIGLIDRPLHTGLYSHRLSYDAESILWLLLWWAIQAQPKKGNQQDLIPHELWVDLTGGKANRDPRHSFVNNFPDTLCHAKYRPLDKLLKSLFDQLSGYHEHVARPPATCDATRMKEDYLHEAFQRVIFEFIVKNSDEAFMQLEINTTRRPKEKGAGMSQTPKTPATGLGLKRSFDVMEEGEWTNNGTKKKKKNPKKVEAGRPNTRSKSREETVAARRPSTRSRSKKNKSNTRAAN